MSHVYCPECGFQNPEAANYCSKCGSMLASDESGETTMTFAPEEADEAPAPVDSGIAGPALVVRSGAGRPRSTSLLPPYHVAVFDRGALVESLAQAGVVLEAWHAAGAPPAGAVVSFITGPSRTADIELTLTRGVHGPREVHAIFVDAETRG